MPRFRPRQPDVGRLRAADYPDAGEQLGALWKLVEAMVTMLPPERREDMRRAFPDAFAVGERVQAVKSRFPKGHRK